MNVTEIKEVLHQIGWPVTGTDEYEVLGDLATRYGAVKVGSSMYSLGDAMPLYARSGNAAFLIDNPDDLRRACQSIKQVISQRKGVDPVVIATDTESRYIKRIKEAVDFEVDHAAKHGRSVPTVDDDYQILVTGGRQQIRKGAQIVDDLLSSDKKRNTKGLKAFQELMVY